jgi:6-phosphofructokinase 1
MLKGALVVGQSGGPTPVINASLAGVALAARQQPEISGVYGLVHGIEGALKEELIDLGQESEETLQRLIDTPASALGSCRHKLSDEDYDRVLALFQAHNVRHFVYIGGNDSMDTCHRISALAEAAGYELQVMGVPKTIDNDLAVTDHCPGFGSAARFLALAARDTGRDQEAMATFEDVTVLEAMGRNAGWLAAASALGKQDEADAPHLIYAPEVAFDEGQFLDEVSRIHRRLGRVFVVVCEGVRDGEGRPVGEHQMKGRRDAFGHTLHTMTTGVAAYLADLAGEKLGLRARFLRPVLIGRAMSACVSETDRREALQVGQAAVTHLVAGRSGLMVTLERVSNEPYRCETGVAPLAEVANAEKLLPPEFIDETGVMVTPAFREYALPLIGGELPPLARLKGVRAPRRGVAG